MNSIKKKTIWEYANISKIPVTQVLEDLKKVGFYCEPSDVLNKEMSMKLSEFYIKRAAQREEVKAKFAKLKRQEDTKNNELKQLKDTKTNELKQLKKEQTVRQYANISKISLRQVLEDLKKAGFPCSANDVLDKNMRQGLSKLFRQRRLADAEAKTKALAEARALAKVRAKALTEEEAEEIRIREGEALAYAYAELNTNKEFCESFDKLKQIGKIIDLCVELVPKTLNTSIMKAANNQLISDILVGSYHEYWKKCSLAKKDLRNRGWEYYEALRWLSKQLVIPKWIIDDYQLDMRLSESDIDDLRKSIYERRKHKSYTAGLMEVIIFLINLDFFFDIPRLDFRDFSFIGELFIDMGAIDSALKLHTIDEKFFNSPNKLSLLASKAVQSGNLNDSTKLVEKLIEQEPYHPTIPTIQAEIKRLEQRHCLKATFAIDFSKINELSGVEFENLLLDKFVAMGFKVESTPKIGDFGADLIVENSEGTRIIVQCKRFKSKVNLKAVQEVVGAIGHYGGDMGLVITNNSFLNSAVKLAESHDIELWDGNKLVSFLADDLSFSKIMGSSQLAIS